MKVEMLTCRSNDRFGFSEKEVISELAPKIS